MPLMTYDPSKVVLTFRGVPIVGPFGAESFIKAARNEDGYMLTMGADGIGARTKNANKSGTLDFVLQNSSPSNDYLQGMALLDELSAQGVGALFVKDLTSGAALVLAATAWIRKIPDWERAKAIGETTWTFDTDSLIVKHGGTTLISAGV